MKHRNLYMKHAIPRGGGAFYVVCIPVSSEEEERKIHDILQAKGDWGEATEWEYAKFMDAIPHIWEAIKTAQTE